MQTKVFDEQYARLNKGQKLAVDTIEGPVMVIAGPGTGKTTILTLRIANILRLTDTPPSGILALTFTEAGVKAMRIKLREIIGSRANEVRIHTFHGFAKSVIDQYADHFPHLGGEQLSDIEAEDIIRTILKDKKFFKLRPLGDPDYYISKIIGTISDAKKEAWTPEMIQSFAKEEAERVKNDPGSIATRGKNVGELKGEARDRIEKCEKTVWFAEVYSEYEKIKKEKKLSDFDDLIFDLLNALETNETLLRSVQEQFLYILVDEHQDTNDSQNAIIKIIADFFDTPNLFIVGDEKQAIYRFQGASVENFLKFQSIWGSMKLIPLTVNYRSHQSILDASFGLIENNYKDSEYEDLRVKLESGVKHQNAPIDVVQSVDEYSEISNMIGHIKDILSKDNESSVAIIVRKNALVNEISKHLEREKIEYNAEEGAEVFKSSIGRLLFSLLEYFIDPSTVEHLAEGIGSNLWHLNFQTRLNLLKNIRSSGAPDNTGEVSATNIQKEIKELPELQKHFVESAPLTFLTELASKSGLLDIALSRPKHMQIWRDIYALAQSLAKQKYIDDPKTLAEELLSYKKSAERRVIKYKKTTGAARINVLTVHASKGLEYDYVFMPISTEEAWSLRNRGASFVLPKEPEEIDALKDERRLFYVGLTRARKHAQISYSECDELGKPLTPLRFLDELDQNHVNKVTAPKTERAIEKVDDDINTTRNTELLGFIKQTVEEKGLSVTALNHFLECPNKFIYKSILKVPEAPNPSSEKGNAMHEAMRNVWIQKKSKPSLNAKEIEGIIIESVQTYFKKSLLQKTLKEVVLEELHQNASKVASELVSHFNQPGEAWPETWKEADFDLEYDGRKMQMTLHGKLDCILETQNDIKVFDYKTKEGMSEKAIRGETTNEDGNYFRQLVFYKILIDADQNLSIKNQEFSLIFVKPNKSGKCPVVSFHVEPREVEELKNSIHSLYESIYSGKILSSRCSDPSCEFCNLRYM